MIVYPRLQECMKCKRCKQVIWFTRELIREFSEVFSDFLVKNDVSEVSSLIKKYGKKKTKEALKEYLNDKLVNEGMYLDFGFIKLVLQVLDAKTIRECFKKSIRYEKLPCVSFNEIFLI